jgi:hypothetical protein
MEPSSPIVLTKVDLLERLSPTSSRTTPTWWEPSKLETGYTIIEAPGCQFNATVKSLTPYDFY